MKRREMLKGLGLGGALSVFAAGYGPTLQALWPGSSGEKPASSLYGQALEPECQVDPLTGEVRVNPDQYLAASLCLGCTSVCGVRVRVDRSSGKVLRVTGNPYYPLAASPALPYETSLRDSLRLLSSAQDSGQVHRAAACGRGNAVLEKLDDPYRVLTTLKRVGPRGSGKWEPISLEQLVAEITEGGDLFGEGQVDGLRALHSREPIDPQALELGPKANQLAFITGYANGRIQFARRFAVQAFGTINFANHQGNCGLSMRAAYAALLGDFHEYPHLKPDYRHCTFYLSLGSAPANAGNPFLFQSIMAAEGRVQGGSRLVVVDPVLTNADSLPSGKRTEWVPVKPGTDGALAMGMIRRILETRTYNASFLGQPGELAAKAAGEPSWCNATHLVLADPTDPDFGKFLKARDLFPDAPEQSTLVLDEATGQPVPHDRCPGPAKLFVDGSIDIQGRARAVKSSLQLLLEQAQKMTIEEYAQACGVPTETIIRLADEFAAHGRTAVADCHGGTMHSSGFYAALAVLMLNALAGNLNWKGGANIGAGKFKDVAPGPRYDLAKFPGQAKPEGVPLSRQYPYEKTSEFKRLKESSQNPYPAKAPWYPLSNSIQSEYLPSALNAYPYALKAVIFWNTNPIYGQAGLYNHAAKELGDPKKIPLMVCVDGFLTETAAMCDYVVPDVALYEGFGFATPWAGNVSKMSTAAWPCVPCPVVHTAQGDPVCMETLLLALAEKMRLPGFGDKALTDKDGNALPLKRPGDWYYRGAANLAFDGEPVPEATDDDLNLSGVDRIVSDLQRVLKPEEWRRAAHIYARGGRFEPEAQGYQDQWLKYRHDKPMQIWCEPLALSRNSMTGRRHVGAPTWVEPLFCEETPVAKVYPPKQWPFHLISTKSQLMSSGAVGSPRLHAMRPQSQVAINLDDALGLGIKTGDRVRIETPGGSVVAMVTVRRGVAPGVVAIEHGFGHWTLGASPVTVGDKTLPASPMRRGGVLINTLGLTDPFRQGLSTLGDFVMGANARNAIAARIEKL